MAVLTNAIFGYDVSQRILPFPHLVYDKVTPQTKGNEGDLQSVFIQWRLIDTPTSRHHSTADQFIGVNNGDSPLQTRQKSTIIASASLDQPKQQFQLWRS